MIEFTRARSGASLLRKDGRFLGSAYDPVREGEGWAERAELKLSSMGCAGATAVVLGLGSGYGVDSLMRRLGGPRVVVLEPDADVVAGVKTLIDEGNADLARLDFSRIACGAVAEAAMDAAFVLGALRGPFTVFTTGASADADLAWHRRAVELLLAREPSAFLWALKDRPSLAAVLDFNQTQFDGPQRDRLVSVKTIAAALRPDASGREVLIWRALEEMTA